MITLSQSSIEEAFKSEELSQLAAKQITQNILNGTYDISQFVESLGFALTSPSVELRVRGTQLLSNVLLLFPKDLLNITQLEYLTTFYSDRLKDQHNVIPAVIDGIEALISMKSLPQQSVRQLLSTFFMQTTCQSQLRGDRAKLFRIFKYLSEKHEAELKAMSGDFIAGLINSIDGERDPRNLDYIYSFMPQFIANFPLLHLTEEVFEIFACYFPIDFTPTTNDPASITRDNLAEKLTNCLVASPDFVEWTVTLALEKLDSDLVVAKLDSLELLRQSALKFPTKILEPYFEQIWQALKLEVFPGSDNDEIIAVALRTLCAILEEAAAVPEISHNYQTIILGTILTHLSDVNQRLFKPATGIALVCISGDAKFASDKILNTFLLKLQEKKTTNSNAETSLSSSSSSSSDTAERIQIYNILAQVFKITALRNGGSLTDAIDRNVCVKLHEDIIASLAADLSGCACSEENLELKRAALSVLNESAPLISEENRALTYRVLVQLITHETIDLEFTQLLELIGALYPIELQSNCIDICIRNFSIYSNFVKRKIFKNLLPLVTQMAFTQRVLDLLWSHIFAGDKQQPNDVRLLALEALNELLKQSDEKLIVELQQNQCLIDKLVILTKVDTLNMEILEQIAVALSRIVQQLPLTEQYMIATEYLPNLNLQLASDLFVAKGLLGFLHSDISLDDHFERLLNDLTDLSLLSDDERLRKVAHHLLCSLVNKIDYRNSTNKSLIVLIVEKLKKEIKKEDTKAVEALSWLAKGLIVCGLEEVGDIIETLAELLEHPKLSTAAVLAFDIISAEYPELHLPIVKYLFKQKFFHTVLSKLGNKLESYCEHHLNAFIYVLKTTPHAVLKMHIEKIAPILFNCLESTHVHTLCISLDICQHFIRELDEHFRSQLNYIIPKCIQLTKFEKSMEVRIHALNVLFDITKYPIFVLLPHKMDVVLELADALDDHKRLVRNAAVNARNAWYLIGAPKTDE